MVGRRKRGDGVGLGAGDAVSLLVWCRRNIFRRLNLPTWRDDDPAQSERLCGRDRLRPVYAVSQVSHAADLNGDGHIHCHAANPPALRMAAKGDVLGQASATGFKQIQLPPHNA